MTFTIYTFPSIVDVNDIVITLGYSRDLATICQISGCLAGDLGLGEDSECRGDN